MIPLLFGQLDYTVRLCVYAYVYGSESSTFDITIKVMKCMSHILSLLSATSTEAGSDEHGLAFRLMQGGRLVFWFLADAA